MLMVNENFYMLELLQDKYGFGYSDQTVTVNGETIRIGALQAKLSIMMEAASKRTLPKPDGRE